MKKTVSIILAVLMIVTSVATLTTVNAVQSVGSTSISFNTEQGLYAHAVLGSNDTEAWLEWQCEHNEDLTEINPMVKYFFLPTSADKEKVDIYNAYSQSVTLGNTTIGAGETKTVTYSVDTPYSVSAGGKTYTLKFMKSNAEAAVYINNSDADGKGTDLMSYLNVDKSHSSSATGAIVNADGKIDNTGIKKIKGRGNTTWGKSKKPYNITYNEAVSIGGMQPTKKYSILANYQDDSLSRNRLLYDLSDAVGMPYASDSRYVDFYVNGFYWGTYQMAQKVDVGKSDLVNDIDDMAYINDDGTINKDFPFLCEIDASASQDDYCVPTSSGNNITIKCPELSEGDPGYEEVKSYIATKFDEFFNALVDPSEDLSKYADIDSLTKIYLINEIGKNWDSGVSSLFFTYKQDTNGNYKFYGSPVWDYDNSLGNATGVYYELNEMGVDDYTEYSGWWCKYKGKTMHSEFTPNIMNNIANNKYILDVAPNIWFEKFMPAINAFETTASDDAEMYSADRYHSLLKDSAEMNYKSGWLINTGSWISNHSILQKATFDFATGTYNVNSQITNYDSNTFDGAFDFCKDWLLSRAAWLSSQMYPDYTPTVTPTNPQSTTVPATTTPGSETTTSATTPESTTTPGSSTIPESSTVPGTTTPSGDLLIGDVDGNGKLDVKDVTYIQKHLVKYTDSNGQPLIDENDSRQFKIADVNGDNQLDVNDVTQLQKIIVKIV